nr:efflux transporter outer membrane subunit [Sphingomonas quercus]
MAPTYVPPATVAATAPAAFKEASGWSAAAPQDAAPRGDWWTIFNDPVLNDLESRVEAGSPTLAAALARFEQARANARLTAADLYPSLSVGSGVSRERQSARRPNASAASTFTDVTVGGSLSYEVDLWGRIRDSVRADRADAEASAADLASARLSLHTALADAYYRLRGLDAQATLLNQTVEAFGRAQELTRARHEGGVASGLDVSRADTVLADARSQLSAVAASRAAVEHEIAALIGANPSVFALAPVDQRLDPPPVPAGAPSELLQRRPDVAAAERRVFAANARIGAARAAFFPNVTLGGSGGFEAVSGALFSTPATYWALGPLQAALAVFDGGARRARLGISRGEYDEAAAQYRQAVLTAFRDVEDGLAASRYLAAQSSDQRDAVLAAERTRDLAITRYRDGASDYLDVVTAQTAALQSAQDLLTVQTSRMRAAVALIRALGGGYGAN